MQYLKLSFINLHMVVLIKVDEPRVKCPVVCRRKCNSIFHVICASSGSNGKNVCRVH